MGIFHGQTIFPLPSFPLQKSCLSWFSCFTCNCGPPHLENDARQTAKLRKWLSYFATIMSQVQDNTVKPLGNLKSSFFTCSVPVLKHGKSWLNWRRSQSPVKLLGGERAEVSLCWSQDHFWNVSGKIKLAPCFSDETNSIRKLLLHCCVSSNLSSGQRITSPHLSFLYITLLWRGAGVGGGSGTVSLRRSSCPVEVLSGFAFSSPASDNSSVSVAGHQEWHFAHSAKERSVLVYLSLHHTFKNDPEMYGSECMCAWQQCIQTLLREAARHVGSTQLSSSETC